MKENKTAAPIKNPAEIPLQEQTPHPGLHRLKKN
jgi:hypothetical protein